MKVITREVALENGLKRYYTGRLCRKGHVSERATSNHMCIECKSEWGRARNIRDKEKISTYNKVYNAKNRERIVEQRRSVSSRRRAYMAEWRKDNAEHISKYDGMRVQNGLSRLTVAKRRAKKKQATPKTFNEFDAFFMEEVYSLAALRGYLTGVVHHVDHIIPLQGKDVSGLHVPINLQVITAQENWLKNSNWEGS